MQSNVLKLYKTKNGYYISPKISKEQLQNLCKDYFQIIVGENKQKENIYDQDYIMFVVGDKK